MGRVWQPGVVIVLDGPEPGVPEALRAQHRDHEAGQRVRIDLRVALTAPRLADLLEGAGFAPVGRPRRRGDGWEVDVERGRTLPDTVGPGMRVLVVGLNPSIVAADAGYGFAGPTNRFWKAATASGLVSEPRDPARALAVDGVGMTDLVKRATPRSAEVSADEYRHGAGRLDRLVRWLQPAVVCFVGLEGWRAAVDRRAVAGWQPAGCGGRPTYVMPSTSGLNASARLEDLVGHLRAAVAGPG